MEKFTSCYPTGPESQIMPMSGRWGPDTAYTATGRMCIERLEGVQNLASWQGVVLNESRRQRPKDGPLSDMLSGQQPRCYRLFFCVVELLFKQSFKRAILTRQQLIYRTFLDHFATVNDADLVCLHHG